MEGVVSSSSAGAASAGSALLVLAGLSPGSQNLLAAINASLGVYIDSVTTHLVVIDNKADVVSTRVDNQEQQIRDLLRRTEDLERNGSGSAPPVAFGGDGGTWGTHRGPLRSPGWTPPSLSAT